DVGQNNGLRGSRCARHGSDGRRRHAQVGYRQRTETHRRKQRAVDRSAPGLTGYDKLDAELHAVESPVAIPDLLGTGAVVAKKARAGRIEKTNADARYVRRIGIGVGRDLSATGHLSDNRYAAAAVRIDTAGRNSRLIRGTVEDRPHC